MIRSKRKLITCQEYGDYLDIASTSHLEATRNELLRDLKNRSKQIGQQVNTTDILSISGSSVKFQKVAGIFNINSAYDVEICPKFLDVNAFWKRDFFTIALITLYGRSLPDSYISSSISSSYTLSDLLAAVYINEFNKNFRNPIRIYNTLKVSCFPIIGYIDWSLNFPVKASGFAQIASNYTIINKYNFVLQAACQTLMLITSNQDLKLQLQSISRKLPSHNKPFIPPRELKNNDRSWDYLYKISLTIIKNQGISYGNDIFNVLPGFVIRTDLAWEDLLRRLISHSYPQFVKKDSFAWGTSIAIGRRPRQLKVHPDIILYDKYGNIRFIIDAKYKGRFKIEPKISRSDLYEMNSFLLATKITTGIIMYPDYITPGLHAGKVTHFETCHVGQKVVIGVKVRISGISDPNGFKVIAANLKQFIDAIPKE